MIITRLSQIIEYICTKSKFCFEIAKKYYLKMVKKELAVAAIEKSDKVLVIGGGNCPLTGILIKRLTGADVTVVDNCKKCSTCSKRFLYSCGLHTIRIVCADGSDMDFSKYSVIHLALQVEKDYQIMKNIGNLAQDQTRIILRMPSHTLHKISYRSNEAYDSRAKNLVSLKKVEEIEGVALVRVERSNA